MNVDSPMNQDTHTSATPSSEDKSVCSFCAFPVDTHPREGVLHVDRNGWPLGEFCLTRKGLITSVASKYNLTFEEAERVVVKLAQAT